MTPAAIDCLAVTPIAALTVLAKSSDETHHSGSQHAHEKRCWHAPAAAQPRPQQLAALGHPAPNRPNRAFQSHGRLVVSHALEVAEDDRRPKLLRQPLDFRIQQQSQLAMFAIAFAYRRC